mgnify:FL=1|tara:strand:+ start:1074 stop:2984 length:1911 start_codon:yes stop_codon:yes gene_type:complete
MPVTKFTNLDFDQIKAQIKDYLRANSDFTDFDFEGSNMSILVDILAYNTYITAFNSNMVVNESFLDSATLRENVVSLARNIGYVPRSRKSSEAIVSFEFKFKGNSNSVKLKKGLVAVGAQNNTSFTFSISDDITANSPLDAGTLTNERTAKFENLSIYQGTLLTKFFVANSSLDQRFILDNSFIDSTSIRVFVRKSGSTSGLEYSRIDNITSINEKSNVYLIQEVKDEKYELLFGDGLFGKKLESGDQIEVSYIITDGKQGNDGRNFNFSANAVDDAGNPLSSISTVDITTIQSAKGGADIENVESIKYIAPRVYSSQYRAVTTKDYEAIVQSVFPDAESVSVMGGEELDPPEYGTVVLSVKPKNATYLSDFTKVKILDSLKKYAIAGINQRIVDLKLLYIELDTTVYYNSNIFSDIDGLKSQVTQTLTNYGKSTNLNAFGGRFKFSEVQKIVDGTNSAITSNITRLIMRRDLKPIFNAFAQYELCFGNAFHVNKDGKNIKSTGFTIDGNVNTLYFTDLPHSDLKTGDIAVIQLTELSGEDAPVVIPSAGIVDYVKGEVIINTINISGTSLASGLIEIQAFPDSNDIIGLKDIYLQLDMSNTAINIVNDTISSGQQISGIGYKVTSSYSNGLITRS